VHGELYDSLYSGSLLVAMLAAGLGALLFVYFVVVRFSGQNASRPVIRLANLAGSVALIAMILSITVHLVFGHAPTAQEPMGVVEFLLNHRAYWLVFVLAALAFSGPTLVDVRH
jgi:cytochrome b subunit of formate dehydrogenase